MPGPRHRHDQGGDDEADRHAAAIAEEDPRRRLEVVAQEAEAGARQREGDRPQLRAALGDGQHAEHGARGSPHGAAGAVHVVHQVEGVDDARDEDDRDRQVEPLAGEERPADPTGEQHRSRRQLDRQPGQRRQPVAVVDRADPEQHGGADRDRPEMREAAAEEEGGEEQAADHRDPAQVGRWPVVSLVADRMVVEARAPSQADRQRRQRQRRGQGDEEGERGFHRPQACASISGSERRTRSKAATSSIASSTPRVERQPVICSSAVVSGRRRPSSSKPSP